MATRGRQRRENGAGSIVETSTGWRASIRVPNEDGVPKPKSKRTKTRAEAEEWLTSQRSRLVGGASGSVERFADATLIDFLRHWLTTRYAEGSATGVPTPRTLALYNSMIATWVVPSPIAGLKVARIHADNLTEYRGWLSKQVSAKTGKPLSRDFQREVLSVLRNAFQFAVIRGVIPKSPFTGLRITRTNTSPPIAQRVLTPEDYAAFMGLIRKKGCQHPRYCQLRWELAGVYAKRQSEVLGMQWGAVYLDATPPIIAVVSHMVPLPWKHGCGVTGRDEAGKVVWACRGRTAAQCPARHGGGLLIEEGTKTGVGSIPPIPVSDSLREVIEEHKRQQDAEREAAKDAGRCAPHLPEHHDLVFTSPLRMTAIPPANDAKNFKELLKEAGVTRSYRLHDLRHTAVTRMVSATNNLATAKALAGHRTIQTTSKYAHPDVLDVSRGVTAVLAMDDKHVD